MINKGDKVTVLDDNINGVVSVVKGDDVYVTTEDGFELIYKQKELIKIGEELKNVSVQGISKIIQDKQERSSSKLNLRKKEESKEVAFDLHIEKLIPSTKGMQSFDMLELQIQTAERHIDFAIKSRIPKIVLIHGVGDGRLRAEIEYILKRYENIWFQEASFQRYGQGALEIHFRQNARRAF